MGEAQVMAGNNGARALPEGWRWARLGDVATYINGMAFKPDDWETSGTPIIRIQNLTNPDTAFNYFNGNVDNRYRVANGDLLISWSASLDVFLWNRGPAILNQHIFKVVECEVVVRRDYLFFAVQEAMDEIRAQVHGATMRHITRPEFESITIPLPPLAEQHRIAAVLSEHMAAVERARAAAEARRDAARALPAALLRAVFESEEAQGWERRRLGEICTVSTGTTPSTNQLDYYKGDMPFIKTAEIVNNRISQAYVHISKKALTDYTMKIYPPGTILLAMYGQGKTRGQVGILDIAATTTQNAAAIVPKNDVISEYIWFWLRGLYERLRSIHYRTENMS